MIDFPATLARLAKLPAVARRLQASGLLLRLPRPGRCAERPGLPGRGSPADQAVPRAILARAPWSSPGRKAYVANYFSDSLSLLDLSSPQTKPQSISLAVQPAGSDASKPASPLDRMSITRKGEFYFHDAGICFQGWQSCASCHPGEARVDGLNWDLLNDGIGNPKNTKSLLLSHRTPAGNEHGRARNGGDGRPRRHPPHPVHRATGRGPGSHRRVSQIAQAVPSPVLVKGRLSGSARRGEKLFKDSKVGCATCHPPGLFTDLQPYDVGTRGSFDKPTDRFDTPTLVEIWRTAPYLHDGSAATMREVLTTRNPRDRARQDLPFDPEADRGPCRLRAFAVIGQVSREPMLRSFAP